MAISVITVSELLHGVHRATGPTRASRTAYVEGLLGALPAVPVDTTVARVHADLWAHLTLDGEMIGVHDLWIAATAVAHGFALASRNAREFGRVPGLRLVALP